MIKNAIIYRISSDWAAGYSALEAGADKQQFERCGPTQERSMGWAPPRGEEHGSLVESVGGQWIMRWYSELKMLPASVLGEKLREKCAVIETKALYCQKSCFQANMAGTSVRSPTPEACSFTFSVPNGVTKAAVTSTETWGRLAPML